MSNFWKTPISWISYKLISDTNLDIHETILEWILLGLITLMACLTILVLIK